MPEPMTDWVQIEIGVHHWDEVSVHYDPMIAKLEGFGSELALLKLPKSIKKVNIIWKTVNFKSV